MSLYMKLHDMLEKLYVDGHLMYRKRHRRKLTNSDLAKKQNHLTMLDGAQREEIIRFWQPFKNVATRCDGLSSTIVSAVTSGN